MKFDVALIRVRTADGTRHFVCWYATDGRRRRPPTPNDDYDDDDDKEGDNDGRTEAGVKLLGSNTRIIINSNDGLDEWNK